MKAKLSIELSKVSDFDNPKIELEQYRTPPELAADILHTAFMQGDIEGKKVIDLGTGTGIFAIGAALLGAEVTAVDKDNEALELAEKNAERLGVSESIEFVEENVEDFQGEFDTAVMNPPFSVHSDIGIRFFEKAVEIVDTVYSVAHPGSQSSIKDFVENSNHVIEALEEYKVALPPTYGFHTEESRETRVDVIITRDKDGA
ncbi:MAG: METTL5 family protein [Candidatus Nanohaloarchaea archaeon]